ncbi:mechanosensitive ion channel domain-containing protein [Cellulomonas sp. C5510]|uniref:mechanosensitive ion channel domain-containing protein n=1 Tax=Cellulomonas sp. C5510 TaxID=2871170 RepID=UPI001C961AEC|nr:mechanosensitive ion channel domain-containing protein [Cellulomonas sp. C5510]QZN87721.1 mechanosensitive ion channel [Cellulomonas sp. C5510]
MIPAAVESETADTARDVLVPVLSVAGAVVAALLVAVVIGALVRSVAKKSVIAADLARRSKHALRAVLVVIATWIALRVSVPDGTWESSGWMRLTGHVLLIALIVAVTWLVGTLAFVVEDAALSRYRVDVKDNRHARRVRTQIQLLRRITVAVLVIVATAAVLLTFPGVSAFGASLLASAGVLSIVAGLAAQSSLANVFAGLQLAFTDAIRVDDVVIVEDEWGRIEEITLTYVVVHVWDDRRLILPSTYFTQTPFENWTRRAAELLGTVEIDVDWQVPVDDLRAELNRLLAATDLWDHRVGVLQVTDAVNGVVRLRALASAADAPTLFDLRCYLREGLVAYLQRSAPQGLPRTRIETTRGAEVPVGDRPRAQLEEGPGPLAAAPEGGQQDARLFTGSVEALERSRSFAGPGQDVIAEREEHAAEARAQEEAPAGRTSGGRTVGVVAAPGTAAVPAATPPAGDVPDGSDDRAPQAPAGTVPEAVEPARSEAPTGSGAPAGAVARDEEPVRSEAPTGSGALTGAAVDDAARPAPPPASGSRAEAGADAPDPSATPADAREPGTEVRVPRTDETQLIDPAGPGTMVLPAVGEDAPGPADQDRSAGEGAAQPPTRRSVRSAPRDPR